MLGHPQRFPEKQSFECSSPNISNISYISVSFHHIHIPFRKKHVYADFLRHRRPLRRTQFGLRGFGDQPNGRDVPNPSLASKFGMPTGYLNLARNSVMKKLWFSTWSPHLLPVRVDFRWLKGCVLINSQHFDFQLYIYMIRPSFPRLIDLKVWFLISGASLKHLNHGVTTVVRTLEQIQQTSLEDLSCISRYVWKPLYYWTDSSCSIRGVFKDPLVAFSPPFAGRLPMWHHVTIWFPEWLTNEMARTTDVKTQQGLSRSSGWKNSWAQ